MIQHPLIFAVSMEIEHEEKELFLINEWSRYVDQQRLNKINRFHFWQDKWRSLAGDMLVRYMLTEVCHIQLEQIQLSNNLNGKPVLINHDLHFNVSHSGKWVVVVMHHSPVGIDIERIGKADYLLAKQLFSFDEYEVLQSVCSNRLDEAFFHIWTAKESYVKAIGKGLSIPLDSFIVTEQRDPAKHSELMLSDEFDVKSIIRNQVMIKQHFDTQYKNWYIKTFDFDTNYSLTMCSTEPSYPYRIEVITTSQLIW